MVFLTNKQKLNLIPKQQQRDIIKYGTGIRHGQALYQNRRRVTEGGSFLDFIGGIAGGIARTLANNSGTIKDATSAVGNVVSTVGKIGTTAFDIAKRAKELNQMKQQGITNEALEQVVNTKKEEKSGKGFYEID